MSKELAPEVEGVVVIADGGDNAVVAQNITEAVQALFGVEAHKIKNNETGLIHRRRIISVKRLFKKNQIIIATLAVMIAVAGYLNYSGKLFGDSADGTEEANADLANQELLDISQEDLETGTEDIESNDSEVEGTPGEAVLTSGGAETTVAQAKVTREQVRAQNKETLQGIIDNTNLSDAEKQSAVTRWCR